MTHSKHILASLVTAIFLAACGGGGSKDLSGGGTDNGGGGNTGTPSVTVATKSCTDIATPTTCTAAIELPAEKPNRVEAVVLDANGKAVAGALVAATTDNGTISPAKQITDSQGVAAFTLTAPAANTEGAGSVTLTYTLDGKAYAGQKIFTYKPGATSSDNYQLTLTLKVCTDISDLTTCTEQSKLPTERASLAEAILLDPKGEPVVDAIIHAVATKGEIRPSDSRLTDSAGKATFLLASTTDSAQTAGTFTASTTVPTGDITAAKNYEFGASNLKISLTSDKTTLPAGSVAVLTALLTLNDQPYPYPIDVTFSSACASADKATLDAKVATQQGTAIATYKGMTDNYACAGNDTITATAAGLNELASVTITNQTAETRSITAGTPDPEFMYLRGSGKGEKSTVTFTLKDAQNKPVSGKQLNFTFGGNISNNVNYQDYTLSPLNATTNIDGMATVTINSGNLPTPISVIATLNENTEIRAASKQIGVGIGYADDNSISFSADKYNINGAGYDGEEAKITLRLADRFNNPVADGTKVYFTTEGGSIASDLAGENGDVTGVCSSKAGVCTATLTSQDPRPADGRVTVSAYVSGEESFLDYNGNGIFDKGELTGVSDDQYAADVPNYVRAYNDIGERFMDVNVDDTAKTNPSADIDGFRAGVDLYEDLNANGKRDLGDGVYTGLVCDKETISRGFCKRELTTLFRNAEFIFTGLNSSSAGSGALPLQVYNFVSKTWETGTEVDLRDGVAKYVRVLPMHLPHDASGSEALRLANPIPKSLGDASNFGDLTAYYDLRGANPIPAGSTFSVTNDNGGTVKTLGFSGGNCNADIYSPYPSTTRPMFYCVVIFPEETPNKKTIGALEIKVTAPAPHQDGLAASVVVRDNG
jgi:hypothetical protein